MHRFVSHVIWFYVGLHLNRIPYGECLESDIPIALSTICKKPNDCLSFVTQDDCRADEYLDVSDSEGCCPTCKHGIRKWNAIQLCSCIYFGRNANCILGIIFLRKYIAAVCGGCNELETDKKCAPGLRCNGGVCVLDKGKNELHFKRENRKSYYKFWQFCILWNRKVFVHISFTRFSISPEVRQWWHICG